MDPNLERIERLLDEALQRPPTERAAFLDTACRGDESLRREVEALLAADAAAGGFLGADPEADGSGIAEGPSGTRQEGPGTMVGRYKLLEQIGEGGFGVVFMAEQTQPVQRRVALKVIKPGMDSKQVIGRFEAERQALALMEHPNIAQVFDAGTTDAGRPYFVMELVRGIPITTFCREQDLDIEQRLRLLVDVCAAVQHAHQKGIIHRDLKPSNILVTLYGDQPVPKVIDFGIAKATGQSLTDKTVFTQFQQFMGTPAYMSPEQATLSGLDVDTRSDIYSLGVLLYEILTGRPPFETKELLSVGMGEMLRIIREQDPERPSTKLSKSQSAREAGGLSPSVPRRPQWKIATDLDWIVMKALEKDRARRYETANGLAADLKRYLNNEPVTAVAPTLVYQLTKFYHRNRRFVRLANTFGALLLAATAFSTWMAMQATRAKEEQSRLREEAYRQREVAETAGRLAADRAEELARRIYYKNIEDATAAIDRGDQEIARGLLLACDLEWRRWEWRYLNCTLPPRVALPAKEQPIFTQEGELIMIGAGNRDHYVQIWNPATGDQIRTVIENDADMCFLSRSADGRLLATGQADGVLKLWNSSGEVLWAKQAHTNRIDGIAFSPDGASLASCSWDETVKLWDAGSGRLLRQWGPVGFAARGVVFSPDGQRIVIGNTRYTYDRDLEVWGVQTGEAVFTLNDVNGFKDAVFSPDGRWIATSVLDGTVTLWDASTAEPVRTMSYASPRQGLAKDCIAFSRDAERLVVADSVGVRILEVATGDLIHDVRLPDAAACFWVDLSVDNRRLAAFMRTGDSVYETYVWDLQRPQPDTLSAHTNTVLAVSYSPNGQTLATASSDGTLKIWNATEQKLIRSFPIRNGWVLAFSADGHQIFGQDSLLARWDLETAEKRLSYPGSAERLGSCSVSPDGRQVATGGRDKIVRIWDVDTGRLLHELHGHSTGCYSIYSVAYSPDGGLLASAACDGTLRIWDAESGRPLRIFRSGVDMPLLSIVFSPNGRVVWAGSKQNNSIYAWEVESGKQLMRLSGGHRGMVWGLAMSPDGQRIASGGELGMWTIWDANTGHRLISRDSGQGSIWTVAWSPDGRTIATGGGDGTVKFWHGCLPATNGLAEAQASIERTPALQQRQ